MTRLEALTAELRLLYQYGESTTFTKDAQRILGVIDERLPTVTLTDALDQVGAEVHRIQMEKKQR